MIHLPEKEFPVEELISTARAARERAYAPYSRFRVGAALLTAEGRLYGGCNIENASYGLTVCAERVAIFKAVSSGEKIFAALAIISDGMDYCTPCGACRQVLMEFAPAMNIYMCNDRGEYKRQTAAELLPAAFDARSVFGSNASAGR